MKISAFTFLRNALINGFPFEESIRSILPLCDEYIAVVGKSDDDTLERVKAIGDPKIRIVETIWNENMNDRGFIYGQQKMIGMFHCTGDWAFYLEGDEVLHEDELPVFRESMERYVDDPEVEAFYFDFYHFYGVPNQVGIAGYRRAPRIIRNTIRAIAPGGLYFVVMDRNKKGRYPKARHAGGHIYHYGHVRAVEKMNEKVRRVAKYWGGTPKLMESYGKIDRAELRQFKGTHPHVMEHWLEVEAEKTFEIDPSYRPTKRDLRNRMKFQIEQWFGLDLSKKHYTDLS